MNCIVVDAGGDGGFVAFGGGEVEGVQFFEGVDERSRRYGEPHPVGGDEVGFCFVGGS